MVREIREIKFRIVGVGAEAHADFAEKLSKLADEAAEPFSDPSAKRVARVGVISAALCYLVAIGNQSARDAIEELDEELVDALHDMDRRLSGNRGS